MKTFYTSLLAISLVYTAPSFADQFSDVYKQYSVAVEKEDSSVVVELAKQTLELGENKFSTNSENLANLQYNLANAYADNKQFQNAFNAMYPVTTTYKTLYGEHSEQLFQALINQLTYLPTGDEKNYAGNEDSAKLLALQAIEIAEHLTQQQPDLAHIIHYMLSKQISKPKVVSGIFKQAKHFSNLAYIGLLAKLGPKNTSTIDAQFRLAGFEYSDRNYNKAAELYEDIVDTLGKSLNTSHPFELVARGRLIHIYERQKKSNKATKHCVAIGEMTPWKNDMDPTPLFRLEPTYPLQAAKDGREGWTKMAFTIDEKGIVNDINIIESKGGNDLKREALKAFKKWRYAPKFIDGKAVTATDLTVQLDFKLIKS